MIEFKDPEPEPGALAPDEAPEPMTLDDKIEAFLDEQWWLTKGSSGCPVGNIACRCISPCYLT